jgi:hypothetical protein
MGWLGVVVAIALVVATFGLAHRAIVGDGTGTPASADVSSERAEHARMVSLAPVSDASWERAESERMLGLSPSAETLSVLRGDSSWERAEEERMRRLGEG